MNVNERIQNMLSERIDTLEAVIVILVRQVVALESDINAIRCSMPNETKHKMIMEDVRSGMRKTIAVLKAATQ